MDRSRTALWVVAGLGNPGPAYRATRHNIGFVVADRLVDGAAGHFRPGRHEAHVAALVCGGTPVVVLKPQTFMNRCGPAVAAWAADLQVPAERVVVVHDDLDLPVGRLRIVSGGGPGGHRGVASIHAALGTQAVPRVRLGIGRPPEGVEAAEFVLQAFRPEEAGAMDAAAARAALAVKQIVIEGLAASMNLYNAAPRDAEARAAGDLSMNERRMIEGG